MENYVQSNEPGDMYIRPKAISLVNPKDQVKSIVYFMESVVNLKDGSIIKTDMGTTTGYFSDYDLAQTIKLFNPLTMEELGEKSVQEMVDMVNMFMFSYMVHTRNPQPLPPDDVTTP